ncbi:PAS domain S-box protein [Microcoleus sp. LEGE 07076]|uniref:PAS domain S-box protein n=1 Tax=Microcoleus sp. LEGE 07076 TaxID=915322 RepID=UPI00187E667A|nr:PAS domain S-box protein [Microcoleus sp. LEGE 07076]MBE9187206.1 PAS domain S-box protein [Microcoleus sp. LEGE 07076]
MKNLLQIPLIGKAPELSILAKSLLIYSQFLVHIKQQETAYVQLYKKINEAKYSGIILLLILTILLFSFNWSWVASNGNIFYIIKREIAILGIANIVLLGLAARSHALAAKKNDRQSGKTDKCDRFFSLSPDMLCIVGFDGYFKRINQATETILGYAPAEIVGKPFVEFLHPDDRQATLKEAESVAAGNHTVGFENRWRCRNGSYKWVAWTVSPFCEEELMYAIGRDITDSKLAQESLEHSNSILRSVIESTPDIIFVKDIQGRYAIVNTVAADWLQTSADAMLGRDDTNLFPPEIAQQIIEGDRQTIAGGENLSYEELVPKNGEMRTLLTTKCPWKNAEGNIIGVVGVSRDISDRKQAEKALQESEERYRCLIQATSQIVWDMKTAGEFVTEQTGWSAFTGSTYDQIKGWGWIDNIHPDDREYTARMWSEAVADRSLFAIQHRLLRHDGEYRYMSARAVPVFNADGSVREWVGTHSDITDGKITEQQLQHQEEFLRSIYDSVDYSIFVVDVGADGEFRYSGWNSAAELLSGISSECGRGKTPEEILSESTAAFFRNKLRECMLENSSVFYEQAVSFGTTEVWSITTLTPLRDESGKIYRIVGSAVEITDRKKAEQALAEQLKLSLFSADVGMALTQNQTLPEILQNCTDAVVGHLDAAFARIWTLNEEGNVLELQASSGMYTHLDGAHSRIAVGEFKIGLIAREQKPHLTNSVQEDARVSDKEWAQREGMVAFAGYPLIVDDRLVGVIAMFGRQELTESTLISFASIADSIALGIKRKQTEEALAAQTQTLRGIIDNAPIWVWMANPSGRMLLVNKTFCEDVAVPESRFLAASHYSEVLGLEASANCMASDVEAWSQDTPSHAQELLLLADGECHEMETIKAQVKDDCGKAIGLIGLGLDVTKQKEAQRQLQESEARFRKLAEQETLLNQLASKIRKSLDLDTILATTVHQIRELLQLDRCVFIWYAIEASQPVWDLKYEAKNADLPSLLGVYPAGVTGSHAERIANLEIIRIDDFETVTDPVEREFFTNIGFHSLLNIPVQTSTGKIGVISCNACSGVRYWSDEEVELLVAVGNQLAIGINQSELYTQSVDSARIAQEQTAQLEATLCELQQAQTQLVQAEKMSSLGQMVAGIAHEINNPVSFIFGNLTYTEEYTRNLMKLLQMYRDEYPEPSAAIQQETEALEVDFLLDDLPKMLSSMQVGATRIRDIVRSLRNFSRLDESDMKNVNIHEGIDSTLMILEHRLKAQLVSVAGTEYRHPAIQLVKEYGQLPLVECYAGLLNQVFMNVIANAIDALQERVENQGIIRIRTEVEGTFARIVIADNGPGISDRVKQRIFDPFYTTKPIGSGTGMGLAISHSIIVEKHQGKINCCSAVGKGTEFAIEIPIQRREN